MEQLYWNIQTGGVQIAQSYAWDGAPEVQTVTVAGGKATFAFKGKMKRTYGDTPPAAITVEGSVTGIPLK